MIKGRRTGYRGFHVGSGRPGREYRIGSRFSRIPEKPKYNTIRRLDMYIYNGTEPPHLLPHEIFSLWTLRNASFLRQSRASEKRGSKKGSSQSLESRANKRGVHSLLKEEKYQEKQHAKPSDHTAAPFALGSLTLRVGDGVRSDSVSVLWSSGGVSAT